MYHGAAYAANKRARAGGGTRQLKRVFLILGYSLDLACLDQADSTVEDTAAICGFDPTEMLDEFLRASKNWK